ncbi:unnamed protein product, partial [Ranitomeya imitator]
MTLTLEHLHLGITRSKEQIANIENQLTASSTAEELAELKGKINTVIDQHRRDTEARKRSKFIRDAEDYENKRVYKWRDSFNSGTFSSRSNYRSTTDVSTSGSDQERHDRPPPTGRFLGQGRSKRRRRPAGERDIQRNTDFMRITRSQVPIPLLRQDFDRGKLKVQPNLTPLDQQALNSLQSDKGIIIKPADKGGGIVVMDKIKYTQEAYRQLHDTSIYTPLDRDPTNTIKNLIKDTLMKYCEEGVLDQKTCEYLIKQNPITPVFYILPKIHKNLNNPPGRPIVASTESILSPISKFLEKILTPLIQQTPSFLLDTGKFLELIHNLTIIPKEAFLVTFDVKDLYTSIPHIEGIKSVRTLLTSSKMDPVQINLCCDLLSIILTKNFFLFEDQFFLQTRGTAMGSNAAPPYANCYMADYEESAIYTNCLFKTHALMWKRYIDDIFCIWDGPEETLKTFFLFLKTSWPGLDFTITYNQKEVNFLDTLVCKNDQGELSTDLFTKPTDRNSLLHYHSFHPTRMKNAIPKSQFKRVHRIVSDKTRQTQRLDEMRSKFLERGYPPQTLNTSETISTTRTSSKDRIPFVHDYHPLSYILHRSIRRYWHILGTAHPRIKEFKEPFLPCFRRPHVNATLSHSKIWDISLSTMHACNNVTRGSTFYHPHNGKQYNIKGYFTCDTSFVVYLIKCPCGLCYIGETTQPIKDRISKHKSTIRCKNTLLPIPHHFAAQGHTVAQLKFQVLEQVTPLRRGGDR